MTYFFFFKVRNVLLLALIWNLCSILALANANRDSRWAAECFWFLKNMAANAPIWLHIEVIQEERSSSTPVIEVDKSGAKIVHSREEI